MSDKQQEKNDFDTEPLRLDSGKMNASESIMEIIIDQLRVISESTCAEEIQKAGNTLQHLYHNSPVPCVFMFQGLAKQQTSARARLVCYRALERLIVSKNINPPLEDSIKKECYQAIKKGSEQDKDDLVRIKTADIFRKLAKIYSGKFD